MSPLPPRDFAITLPDLVRYAGAGGDFNPIHWHRRTAQAVGLPDVIAHGMFTMALAGRYVTDWSGDPDGILELAVRFRAPVVVPDDDHGATVTMAGVVTQESRDRLTLSLTAHCDGTEVLSDGRAVIRRPAQ